MTRQQELNDGVVLAESPPNFILTSVQSSNGPTYRPAGPENSLHRRCIMNTTLRKKIYIRCCCVDRLSRHFFSSCGRLRKASWR